jgi:hypothetical protein
VNADVAVPTTSVGYWVAKAGRAAADGFGDAIPFDEGAVPPKLVAPVVGVAGDASGLGYWTAASDGGVFTHGDAAFFGSAAPFHVAAPVVSAAPTRSGRGYWLVGSDGGVFTFGDATYTGSLGGHHLAAAITGISARFDGGYWLLGSDGGVFSFGGAPFLGSAISSAGGRATGLAATPDPLAPLQ